MDRTTWQDPCGKEESFLQGLSFCGGKEEGGAAVVCRFNLPASGILSLQQSGFKNPTKTHTRRQIQTEPMNGTTDGISKSSPQDAERKESAIMSHYKVYVITEDGDVDDALAPFDENREVDPYIDVRKEDVVPNFRKAHQQYLENWIEDLKAAQSDNDKEKIERAERMIASNKEDLSLSDEEIYRRETEDRDLDEDGNILSTYNPDSKWDWYDENGGRWQNGIRTRDGRNVNQCRVSDVRLAPGPDDQEAYEKQKHVFLIYSGQTEPKNEAERKALERSFWRPAYYLDHYGDADTFALDQVMGYPYAVLLADGTWVEPGEMGWWGISTAKPGAKEEYIHGFADLMKQQPQDYTVTCVDCHI